MKIMGIIYLVETGTRVDVFTPYSKMFVDAVKVRRPEFGTRAKFNTSIPGGPDRFRCWSVYSKAVLSLGVMLAQCYPGLPIAVLPKHLDSLILAGAAAAGGTVFHGLATSPPISAYGHKSLTDPGLIAYLRAEGFAEGLKQAEPEPPPPLPETDPWNQSSFVKKTPDEEIAEVILTLWD
jgi:hypothetical protein